MSEQFNVCTMYIVQSTYQYDTMDNNYITLEVPHAIQSVQFTLQ